MWDFVKPSFNKDSFRCYLAKADQELDTQRVSMGAMVLHYDDEHLHDRENHCSVGENLRQTKLRCLLPFGLLR